MFLHSTPADCRWRRSTLPRRQRPGIVLVSVLIVVSLLSLAAYQYTELMLAEARAADSYARTAQARALADSGVHYVAAVLSDPDTVINLLNYNPYDNPTYFQDIMVGDTTDQPGRQGRFSIVTVRDPSDPLFQSDQPYRFGVGDESAKLNLNSLLTLTNNVNQSNDALCLNMLFMIPNMNETAANSILDWLDSSSSIPRTNGAKDDYYMGLSPPYHCKNGPLDSLEELLLVQGVTPQLLYGNDLNRNGIIDPDEDPGDGTADLGWQQYFTIYSRQPNVSSLGTSRIYLNTGAANLTTLQTSLQQAVGNDLANFIIAYRLYGGTTAAQTSTPFQPLSGNSASSVLTQMATDIQNAQTSGKKLNGISSLFQLTTQTVTVTIQGTGNQTSTVTMPNPLMDPNQVTTLLPLLFDQTTTQNMSDLPPGINVNTANPYVLSMLPNLQPADVASIQAGQPQTVSGEPIDPMYATPAWLLTNTTLSVTTLSGIESYITTSGSVFRFQVLGYFDGPGPTARIEAIIDTNVGRPRVVYYRPITELGKGFTLPKANSQ